METNSGNNNKFSLLTIASHDLKQSLNAVSYSIEALEAGSMSKRQEKIIKTLRTTVDTMERLLSALIDIPKLEVGIIHPQKKHFNLETILKSLRIEYQELSRHRQLNFQCNQTECSTYTDPALLEVIIRNLVANAFQYTPAGEIWIICKSLNNNTLTIEVGDTGLGIPRDKQQKIFAEFYQIDHHERLSAVGSGLGLTIVKKLIKILGLGLTLKSNTNCGSRFIVSVPTEQPEI